MATPKLWALPNEIARFLQPNQILKECGLGLRLLRLPHPRTGAPALFISTPDSSELLWEIQSIRPDNERSWFMGDQVISNGELLVATPIDPAYILAALLEQLATGNFDALKYRTSDDLVDGICAHLGATAGPVEDFRRFSALPCVMMAFPRACESKEFAPETLVYRFSSDRWAEQLKVRVETTAPRISDESKLVYVALAKQGLLTGNQELLKAGQLKAACNLLSHYITPKAYESLLARFDFASLNSHAQSIEASTAAKAAAPKTQAPSKEDAATKKRKAATQASKGVDKLKKVNTKGMTKLSNFFQKPAQPET